MNRLAILILLPVLGFALAGCGDVPAPSSEVVPTPAASTPAHDHSAHDHSAHAAAAYQCPMHPEVTSDEPGTCPICGMDLVPIETPAGSTSGDDGALQLSAAMVNNLGVRTAAVRHGTTGGRVETVGTVAYDDRGRVEVRVRADGYVERLAVRAEGEAVRRGQALFAVFSPRLDQAGNSVKAQRVIEYVTNKLNYNLFSPSSVGLK